MSGITNMPAGSRAGTKKQLRGFSMVEILIVVAIIGIIGTTAIPLILAARQRSLDSKAHNSLRNVISAQQSFYAANSRFGSLDELAASDPPYLDQRFASGTGDLGNSISIELTISDGGAGFDAMAI